MSRIAFATFSLVWALAISPVPARAEKVPGSLGAKVEATVMAPPEIVFAALRSIRDGDDSGSCRMLSSTVNENVVEEVFDGLPVIGKATCVYKETFEAPSKMSFKMIRSDKLKTFEGEWNFQPVDNGTHTSVKLRTNLDTGLKVPFAKQITDIATSNELKEQIADLKKSVENKQRAIAAGAKSY